jgi:glycosyltransferase involved in cell wall biosynthesis
MKNWNFKSMKIMMYKKKQLIESFGGIEKVFCELAAYLSDTGHDVHLVTADKKQGNVVFPIPNTVTVKNLGNISVNNFIKLISPIGSIFSDKLNKYKAISNVVNNYIEEEKFDLIISAGPKDSLDILYKQNYDIPHICTIHSPPEVYIPVNNKKTKHILAEVIPKISVFQVLRPSHVNYFEKNFNKPACLIENAITPIKLDNNIEKEDLIIYVGTIISNKNQSFLIDGFAKIADKYPTWKLELWGGIANENYHKKLIDKINEYNLQDRILLKGTSKNINQEIQRAKICGFISKYEGFSLALLEAMYAKLPIIGLNNAPFINEIIENNKNGLLIEPDIQELTNNLEELINNESLRLKLGDNAHETALKYSPEKIYSKWANLIKELTES